MSRRSERPSTDDYPYRLGINKWVRAGCLTHPGTSWTTTWTNWQQRPAIVLHFVYRGAHLEVANSTGAVQVVKIIHKRCGPDSWRQHFQCSIPGCGACVDFLYVANFKDHQDGLGCRHCLELVYGSSLCKPEYRGIRRMMGARQRAGFDADILRPMVRPAGMQQRTFERLKDRVIRAALRGGKNDPFAKSVLADVNAQPAAVELMVDALKNLPHQSDENAEKIWAAYEAFYKRFDRFLSEAQRARIDAAFPPEPPAPPRFYGGVGDQRRYRPPRPAWRRKP